ncbi:cellulose biosynthesis cyclic di-GMP-binding regulatory protein BcsB [Lichenihabitans sp. PAMC28606]|uniref:cellulose biosynthesis cyclic di-GMP-binding regulatory protein BcsB n=1 Tax=Lichenihabitans sp. PAMC28606 TaxID=2880932 RepID=UPI001D0BA588|nr:cellulose biosynthesis cyclic di-GMP-binding regulatory protein BcsB [Lichenihabitans sp. PAMC28606]UDL93066.1 cellulose biosynthesis cyclic di-GMP-binding regulatory protein BcsB [Lichenihabitans sp. PAMC28606]
MHDPFVSRLHRGATPVRRLVSVVLAATIASGVGLTGFGIVLGEAWVGQAVAQQIPVTPDAPAATPSVAVAPILPKPVVLTTPGRAAAAASDVSVLHRFQAGASRLRFEGENDSRSYAIFLTGAQANAKARLHLTYTNAVSVMPEASHMTVSVNDVTVADAPIVSSAANGAALLDVEVPESVLEPGYNAVKIIVQQRHRVDCSLAATYELWTQLDPAQSGLAFSDLPQETIMDLADLPALAPDATGVRPLRVVVPKGLDANGLDRILRAMEAVVIRGNFTHPSIDIVSEPQDKPGLDLLVGTVDDLRNGGFGQYVSDDQPIAFHAGAKSGESTLVISGLGVPEIETAIADIVKGATSQATPGTAAGLRALLLRTKPIRGELTVSFRDLGVNTQEFSGRLFRAGFDLLMPPDFYAADYGKMTLRIDAGYVAGLDPSSQILVRVNDRDAASLSLRNPNGEVFRNQPITVSLADLRPGYNHVQIEAQVGAPSDKTCDVAGIIDAKKRFVLLETSTLEIPNVARIAHMPSLSATGASGFPYVAENADTQLYLPHPDADSIAAVATFLAHSARSAGVPLATRIVLSKPDIDDHSAIIVGAISDIPATIVDEVGIDLSQTLDVWSNIEAKSEAFARLLRAKEKAGADGRPNLPERPESRAESDLFQKWSANVNTGQWHFDPVDWVGHVLGNGIGLTSQSLRPWKRTEVKYVPDQRSRLLIAQHAAPGGNGATWTLITAPSAELLSKGMRAVTGTSYWTQLEGRIASYDPQSPALAIVPAQQGYFIKTAPLSPGNLRLIAAGWLSSYLEYYVLALVTMSLCLGLATTAVVRRYGVKP